jgi:hypothetical protein
MENSNKNICELYILSSTNFVNFELKPKLIKHATKKKAKSHYDINFLSVWGPPNVLARVAKGVEWRRGCR